MFSYHRRIYIHKIYKSVLLVKIQPKHFFKVKRLVSHGKLDFIAEYFQDEVLTSPPYLNPDLFTKIHLT